jgi:hypothetical protein
MTEPEKTTVEGIEQFRDLPPDKQAKLIQWVGDEVNRIIAAKINPSLADITRQIKEIQESTKINAAGMNRQLEEIKKTIAPLLELEARSGEGAEEILRKAITLYEVATDATAKGNRLAILTPDDEIVREIIGLGPSGAIIQPTAK